MTAKLQEGQMHLHGIRYARLPEANKYRWLEEAKKLTYPAENDIAGWIEFIEKSKQLAQLFVSPEIRMLGYALTDNYAGIDAVVFGNLPHENPGAPPQDGRRPLGKNPVSEVVLVGLMSFFGLHVFGYKQEKDGDHIHQVAPTNENQNTQSNEGRVLFGYHTDDGCFYPFAPDVLFLVGLINKETATLVLTLEEIIEKATSELINQLRRPIFTRSSPTSFDFGNGRCVAEKRPIIFTDEFGIDRIALPGIAAQQTDPEAAAILTEFHAFLSQLEPHKIVVTPGRILGFRNDRVVHGRETIPSENERWLQRAYGTSDIVKFQKATNSDVFARVFDARQLFGK